MKNLLYGLFGLVVVAATAIGGFLGLNGEEETAYGIGAQVEDFTLQTVDGQAISLSQIAGSSGTIVIFTSNSCPFSKLYEDRILQLQDVYGDMGYPVIIINPGNPEIKPDEHPDEIKKWITSSDYKGTYLIDNDQLYMRFGASKTPEAFLLDGDRNLRYRGAIDNSAQGAGEGTEKYLENAIRALQNNQDPAPTETRTMGCVIKG